MVKKNLSIIVVILLTVLLIAMVIWLFDKRMETIEKNLNLTTSYVSGKNLVTLF